MQVSLSAKAAIAGSSRVAAAQPKQQQRAAVARRVAVRAEEGAAAAAPKEESKPWSPPALDSSTPSPIFGGSTGETRGTRWKRAGGL